MGKLRAGIIGLDHYHVTGWSDSLLDLQERIEVVALYDPDPIRGELLAPTFYDPHLSDRLDDSYRSAAFETDLDTLLNRYDLDVALVTLQNVDCPPAMLKLAEAGVHVLADKPLARNAQEARAVVEAARAADIRLAVGFTRRFSRGSQAVRAMVESGRLGSLRSAEAIFNTSSVEVRNPENFIFRNDLNGGGILLWLGVHDIDQLLWLTGERIVEVQAMSVTMTDAPIEVEDVISVAFRFESGALGTLHYAYVLPRTGSDGYLALRGDHGSVKVLPSGAVTWIGPGSVSDPVTEEHLSYDNRQVTGYGAMGATIIEDLLDAIEEGREPRSTGEDAVAALQVIDAIYESARTGRRASVETS